MNGALEATCHPGGGTAMYDALVRVLDGLGGEGANRPNFVVCLTDGEDSKSGKGADDVIRMLRNRKGTTLIIVSVGKLETETLLRTMCSASKNGALVTAENNDGIAKAFKAVSEIINRPATTFEAY